MHAQYGRPVRRADEQIDNPRDMQGLMVHGRLVVLKRLPHCASQLMVAQEGCEGQSSRSGTHLKQLPPEKQMIRKMTKMRTSTTITMMTFILKFCHHILLRSCLPVLWNLSACRAEFPLHPGSCLTTHAVPSSLRLHRA